MANSPFHPYFLSPPPPVLFVTAVVFLQLVLMVIYHTSVEWTLCIALTHSLFHTNKLSSINREEKVYVSHCMCVCVTGSQECVLTSSLLIQVDRGEAVDRPCPGSTPVLETRLPPGGVAMDTVHMWHQGWRDVDPGTQQQDDTASAL